MVKLSDEGSQRRKKVTLKAPVEISDSTDDVLWLLGGLVMMLGAVIGQRRVPAKHQSFCFLQRKSRPVDDDEVDG